MVLSPKSGTPHIEPLGEVCSSESREGSGSFRLHTVALAVAFDRNFYACTEHPRGTSVCVQGWQGSAPAVSTQGPMALPTASSEHTCVLRAAAPALSAPFWPLCTSEGVCGAQIWGDAFSGPPAEGRGGCLAPQGGLQRSRVRIAATHPFLSQRSRNNVMSRRVSRSSRAVTRSEAVLLPLARCQPPAGQPLSRRTLPGVKLGLHALRGKSAPRSSCARPPPHPDPTPTFPARRDPAWVARGSAAPSQNSGPPGLWRRSPGTGP